MLPDNLAIFGGTPAFSEPLHVGRPNLADRERLIERFSDVLESRWFTNDGPNVRELEKRIADLLGVEHCVATCNATLGLEVAARALGLTGEIIVPAFTFVATAHAMRWLGLTPVFCDVDPETHNVSPRSVEETITPRTTAVVGVHLWGRPCDTEALEDLCERRSLRLIFDAAHAFGCSHGGRMIGNFGDAEVFSFHATKFFNTLEGGAVVTNDGDLAERVRLMRNFGFTGYDEVSEVGTNGKMNEVSAAVGLAGLESLNAFVATNRRNYELYRKELEEVAGTRLATYDLAERRNYQYIVVEVDEREAGISRDELIEVLWAENVLARRYFYPGCHRMEPYREPWANRSLPVTERLAERLMLLPTGTAIGPEQVSKVCRIIRTTIEYASAVRWRLVESRTVSDFGIEGSRDAR